MKMNTVNKSKRIFVGRFRVIERIGSQSYRLELPTHWKMHNVFHISLVKIWKTSSFVYVEQQGDSEDLEDPIEKVYKVEEVLRWRKRKIGNKMTCEYLILWIGYPLEEATWEPKANFTYQEQLIEDPEAGLISEE